MNKELEEILQNYRTLFRKQIERIIVLIMEEEKEYLALNLPIDLNLQENLDITKRGEGKETAIEFSQDRNRYEHKVRANVSQEIEEYLKSRPKNLFFNKKDQNADNCVNELFHIISIITHEMRHAYQNELTKIRKDLVNVDALLWLKEQLAVTQDLISQNEKLMFREQDACKYMYRRALEYIEKYTNIKSSNTEVYNNIISQVEEQERIISPIEEIMWITPEGEKRAVDYLNKIFVERANTIPEEIFKDSILRYEYNMDRTKKNLKQLLQDKKIMIDDLLKTNKNKIFIGGSINEEIREKLNDKYIDVIDIMKREELAVLNTISTAEGAIEIAIANTNKILHGSKVLVLGFGRIGKVLARKLAGLSAKVTCAARKDEDLAWIRA